MIIAPFLAILHQTIHLKLNSISIKIFFQVLSIFAIFAAASPHPIAKVGSHPLTTIIAKLKEEIEGKEIMILDKVLGPLPEKALRSVGMTILGFDT